MSAEHIAWIGLALLASALGLLAHRLALIPAGPSPRVGYRGMRRQQQREAKPAFGLVEPTLRQLAAWIAALPFQKLRRDLDGRLSRAGEFLGLTPDELLALCALSALGFGAIATYGGHLLGPTYLGLSLGTMLGAALPLIALAEETRRRTREVERGLPGAIDLTSLCMGAGLDFPGALRMVTAHMAGAPEVREELKRVLDELALGHTRKRALEAFASRVPAPAVRDFVSMTVQAEEKGTPLSEVLATQARMLRMRRSVAAEQAAARAGVLMVIPLMLMLSCMLLLILGPLTIGDSLSL